MLAKRDLITTQFDEFVIFVTMASVQLYSSFEEIKADRVKRPLTQTEKERQKSAAHSLSKIQKSTK